jgi:hypothetical protein
MSGRQAIQNGCLEIEDSAKDTNIFQRPVAQFGELGPKGHLTLHPLEEVACIKAPAPALSFRNPRPTSLSFRAGRQSTMEAATRLPELNPDHTGPARSGLGATERAIFASRSPPEVRNHSRISKHCNPSKTP